MQLHKLRIGNTSRVIVFVERQKSYKFNVVTLPTNICSAINYYYWYVRSVRVKCFDWRNNRYVAKPKGMPYNLHLHSLIFILRKPIEKPKLLVHYPSHNGVCCKCINNKKLRKKEVYYLKCKSYKIKYFITPFLRPLFF
jgi:hypothetical protein